MKTSMLYEAAVWDLLPVVKRINDAGRFEALCVFTIDCVLVRVFDTKDSEVCDEKLCTEESGGVVVRSYSRIPELVLSYKMVQSGCGVLCKDLINEEEVEYEKALSEIKGIFMKG